jgi:integrase
MATAKFNLRESKATVETPIYLIIEHNRKKILKYPTGVKVLPKFWNSKSQSVRSTDRATFDHKNKILSDLKSHALAFISKVQSFNEPLHRDTLRDALDRATKKVELAKADNSLLGFLTEHVEVLKGRSSGQPQNLSKYVTLKKAVEVLEKKNKKKYQFKDIDMAFYHKLVAYLNEKMLKPNSIGTYIKTLKSLTLEAKSKNIATSDTVFQKTFAVPKESVLSVYLNVNEIERLERLDLSDNQRLEKVRDVFLLGYYTGQRYSDYSKYQKDQIENDNIYIRQKKVSQRVVVPLSAKAKAILEKYNYDLRQADKSLQKFNDYLKEVCKLAAINERISTTIKRGNVVEVSTCEKWEMVSSHTARRSYATNVYLTNKTSLLSIAYITGHKSEKQLRAYICLTNEENANVMRNILDAEQPKKESHLRVA